jgi:hypothetical protein
MAFCQQAAAHAAWLLVAARGVEGVRDAEVCASTEKFIFKGVPIRCKFVGVNSDEEDIPIRKNELIEPR